MTDRTTPRVDDPTLRAIYDDASLDASYEPNGLFEITSEHVRDITRELLDLRDGPENIALRTERETLAGIVKDVAANISIEYRCPHCLATPSYRNLPTEHAESCAYRRAVEWAQGENHE